MIFIRYLLTALLLAAALPVWADSAIDIRTFGAKCDGVTDDQNAIVNAVAAAKAANKAVYVPGATCAHSNVITLDSVTVYGDGDVSVLKATNQNLAAITLIGTAPQLRNLRLLTTGTNAHSGSPNQDGAYVNGATFFVVEKVTTSGFSGVGIEINNGATDGRVTNNNIQNAPVSGAGGIFIANYSGVGVTRLIVSGNTVTGMQDDSIAVVGVQGGTAPTDITIANNTIANNTTNGRGIAIVGGSHINVSGNTIRNVPSAGIFVAYDSVFTTLGPNDVVVSNNVMDTVGIAAGTGAIAVIGDNTFPANNIAIVNNIIRNPRSTGISVASIAGLNDNSITNLSIQGNHIKNVTLNSAIEVSGTRDSNIAGNMIDTCLTTAFHFNSHNTGTIQLTGNTVRNGNTSNSGAASFAVLEAANTVTDVVVSNNFSDGTNNYQYGVNVVLTTATLRGSGNKFLNIGTGDYSATLGGLLETYQQGTFTPGISFNGGTTGITYSIQVGRFARIGNRNCFNLNITLTSKGSSTGAAKVTGLPITSANVSNSFPPVALVASNLTFAGIPYGVIDSNGTGISLGNFASAGAAANLTDTAFANNTLIYMSGCYEVSAP